MMHAFSRTELLLGKEGVEQLRQASVCVFGIGGVGSYVVEALARSGVGHLTLVDHDTVSITNLNRQLVALHSTLGMQKVEVARQRILDINPEAQVTVHPCYYTGSEVNLQGFDFIADAIDSVTSKLTLIEKATAAGIPIISCMGTGNKLDPSRLVLTDISKTSQCPLAKVMRISLRKRGIHHLPVLYSTEPPAPHLEESEEPQEHRKTTGSMAFVPGCAGLMIAGEIIRRLSQIEAAPHVPEKRA